MTSEPPDLPDLIQRVAEVLVDNDLEDDRWMVQPDAATYAPSASDDLMDSVRGTYFDRDGRAISLREWSALFEDREAFFKYKIVARTYIHHAFISTVWLGLDHSFGGGPPLIFETMIFPCRNRDKHAPWVDWQLRYPTLADARRAHIQLVDLIRQRGMNVIRTRKQEAEYWRDWSARRGRRR